MDELTTDERAVQWSVAVDLDQAGDRGRTERALRATAPTEQRTGTVGPEELVRNRVGNGGRAGGSFQSCAAGPSNILRFSNRTQRYVQTSDGVKYSSSVSAGAMGSSLTVTATYGSDATVKLAIDQGGKKHRFCVGGDERYVSDSAKLYINLVKDSPPPCQPHLPCPRRGRD